QKTGGQVAGNVFFDCIVIALVAPDPLFLQSGFPGIGDSVGRSGRSSPGRLRPIKINAGRIA
ncbi:MAG: hypothetical protein MUO63_21280, partial [Desulfobulbaceae bacterium]|nr:hypothetical protein [Desulfobulbaceae bacterium]